MNLVFDLDETLVKGDVIQNVSMDMLLRGEIDRVYTGMDVVDFKLTGLPSSLKCKVIKAFSDPVYACFKKEPIPEAYYMIKALLDGSGFENTWIYIVTARPKHLYDLTCKQVQSFFDLDASFIHFANTKTEILLDDRPNKSDILKTLEADVYFDDSIEYCNQAVSAGIPDVYLISNSYTGWNQNQQELNLNVKVIKNVAQFDYRNII
jgi:acid phosphatase class B